MTQNEKAIELVGRFKHDVTLPKEHNLSVMGLDAAKECAIIVVEEIISLRKGYFSCTNPMNDEKYWQEVKQEIEKI